MAFEFKARGLTLELCGAQFTVLPDSPEFLERLERFSREAQAKAEAFSGANIPDQVRGACAFCIGAIDELLGAGAAMRIIGNEPVGFFDLLEVIGYINREVNGYLAARRRAAAVAPANRAQRRQKK